MLEIHFNEEDFKDLKARVESHSNTGLHSQSHISIYQLGMLIGEIERLSGEVEKMRPGMWRVPCNGDGYPIDPAPHPGPDVSSGDKKVTE